MADQNYSFSWVEKKHLLYLNKSDFLFAAS